MSPTLWTTFAITSLVIVATPGTGALYTIAAGLQRGRRASLVAAVGCTLGIVPHLIAAVTGLAAVLHASATAFSILKFAGVAYLLFLAYRTFHDRSPLDPGPTPPPMSAGKVVGQAVLVNLLNPKLTIFFFVFLPQFVAPGQPQALAHMLLLSGVFMGLTLLVFAGYGIFAAAVREHVLVRPRVITWIRRAFAGCYVVLAAKLATADR